MPKEPGLELSSEELQTPISIYIVTDWQQAGHECQSNRNNHGNVKCHFFYYIQSSKKETKNSREFISFPGEKSSAHESSLANNVDWG